MTGWLLRIFDQTSDLMCNRLSCMFALFVSVGAFAQPGTLDQSYGVGGWAIIPNGGTVCEGRAIALAADGSSYLVSACVSNLDIRVVHLDVNGELDTTYGAAGLADIDIPSVAIDHQPRGAAVQPDGKLLIGCEASGAPAVVRLLPDGTLDSAFATNGMARHDLTGNDEYANGLLLLASGKILLYGRKDVGGPNPLVMRLNADGTLDNTFNGTGWIQISVGLVAGASDAVELPDGKVVICGDRQLIGSVDAFSARLLTTGTLDPTYPVRAYSFNDGTELEGLGIDFKPDGRGVITGHMIAVDQNLFAFGLTPVGLVDSTFGVNGSFRFTSSFSFSSLHDVQCSDADGSCRLIGHARSNDTTRVVVVKLSDTGLLDPGYADAGIGSYLLAGDFALGYASTVQVDGKLLVAGQSYGGVPFALRLEDDISTDLSPPVSLPQTLLDLYFDANANAWWLDLPEHSDAARVELIDALGRTVLDQRLGIGSSRVLLPTASLAPGSYLVRATAEGQTSVGRILVRR